MSDLSQDAAITRIHKYLDTLFNNTLAAPIDDLLLDECASDLFCKMREQWMAEYGADKWVAVGEHGLLTAADTSDELNAKLVSSPRHHIFRLADEVFLPLTLEAQIKQLQAQVAALQQQVAGLCGGASRAGV